MSRNLIAQTSQDLEAFRQRNKEKTEALGAKLTPTVLALKAIITALKDLSAIQRQPRCRSQ